MVGDCKFEPLIATDDCECYFRPAKGRGLEIPILSTREIPIGHNTLNERHCSATNASFNLLIKIFSSRNILKKFFIHYKFIFTCQNNNNVQYRINF